VSNPPKCRSSNKITVTQIDDNQFIIESFDEKIRIGGEDEYAISYLDFNGGPLIHIGREFLGRGYINNIEILDTENKNYLLAKITLANTKDE
jgi:hypothetical protein